MRSLHVRLVVSTRVPVHHGDRQQRARRLIDGCSYGLEDRHSFTSVAFRADLPNHCLELIYNDSAMERSHKTADSAILPAVHRPCSRLCDITL